MPIAVTATRNTTAMKMNGVTLTSKTRGRETGPIPASVLPQQRQGKGSLTGCQGAACMNQITGPPPGGLPSSTIWKPWDS